MKKTQLKRILFSLLAVLLCFVSTACKADESNPATGDDPLSPKNDADEQLTQIPVPTVTEEEMFIDELPDDELLGKIGAWRGWSESGTLAERDQYSLTTVKSKKDLDVCRQYLTNFTEEDEKTILADTAGACVLVELTATTENTLYGTSSITVAGNAITILISTDEVEDVLPKYTFFLLYFPQEYYNGEIIDLTF